MRNELTTATEGTVNWEGMQTWYWVVGDLDPASALAPVCRGGSGGPVGTAFFGRVEVR